MTEGIPMAPITVDILVEAGDWGNEATWRPAIERAVTAAVEVAALDLPDEAELSVVLTDDAHIRELNRTWRGKDKPTNVLTFPGFDDDEEPGPMLGDIVIAYETVVAEAAEAEKPVEAHVVHLTVHGMLHLFGYDHEDGPAEAEDMERLERDILARLGLPDPYADTEPVTAAHGDHHEKAK